jgi:hypothetical protein
MPNAPKIPCPTCGSKNVTLIGSHNERCCKPFTDGGASESEPAVTYAFQCECGVGFTETVRESELGKHRAGA